MPLTLIGCSVIRLSLYWTLHDLLHLVFHLSFPWMKHDASNRLQPSEAYAKLRSSRAST
jgi:hypothetical protein